jgi:hypothetical protein
LMVRIPRVVDENVQAPLPGDDLGNETPALGDLGHIRHDHDGPASERLDLACKLPGFLLALEIVDGDVRAFLGEADRDPAADAVAPGGPRDQGELTFQSFHEFLHFTVIELAWGPEIQRRDALIFLERSACALELDASEFKDVTAMRQLESPSHILLDQQHRDLGIAREDP